MILQNDDTEKYSHPEKLLPLKLAQKFVCFPLENSDGILSVATSTPDDLQMISDLSFAANKSINAIHAERVEILSAIEKYYCANVGYGDNIRTIARDLKESDIQLIEKSGNVEALRRETESEPVVRMVNAIIDEAIVRTASDIHIEPQENSLNIRYRIDGMLLESMNLAIWMHGPITSRIKILANLDIAERRMPQDGRMKRLEGNEEIDMRVSTLPTQHGEKTVIRILRHSAMLLRLESLGIENNELSRIDDMINRPQGMMFVTGPTGSGKSSTIFACLNRIKGKAINITTIEDPIEYKLPGVNQVQIHPKAGLTFSEALRSVVRQDPDVIFVGEIRDRETAEIALQSSQTGHLVFSTMHTNDSVSAITRLRDLGIPSYLIASGVLGIVAQRLARCNCTECREPYTPTEELRYRYRLIFGESDLPVSWKGKGCRKCSNTGYKGRIGLYELLRINIDIRELIGSEASEDAIRKKAIEKGMKRLVQQGLEKVSSGVVSIEELLRVVLVD
jgi:type IV pilus assembly protein PilB